MPIMSLKNGVWEWGSVPHGGWVEHGHVEVEYDVGAREAGAHQQDEQRDLLVLHCREEHEEAWTTDLLSHLLYSTLDILPERKKIAESEEDGWNAATLK